MLDSIVSDAEVLFVIFDESAQLHALTRGFSTQEISLDCIGAATHRASVEKQPTGAGGRGVEPRNIKTYAYGARQMMHDAATPGSQKV